MKTEQMRGQIKEYAEKLSPDQIKVAYEFLAKLAADESDTRYDQKFYIN